MRLLAVGVLLAAATGCGAEEDAPSSAAAKFLPEQSHQVTKVSLDYDGDDWEAIKRLYARAVQSGAVRELVGTEFPIPPTLDGALNLAAGASGLSFQDDVRPLLGGELLIGTRVIPAPPLPPDARRTLEDLDPDATTFDDANGGSPRYFDRDGRPLPAGEVEAAQRAQDRLRVQTEAVLTYQAPDAKALERVVKKLEDQGVKPRPLDGVEGAQLVAEGTAIVGGDTIVSVLDATTRKRDVVLREVLRGGEGGDAPPLPQAEDAFVAVRASPGALGLTLDAQELERALKESAAGRAFRGASGRIDVTKDALTAEGTLDFDGLSDEELPLGPPEDLSLPTGEAIASASANQQTTTVFLARLARELLPDSRFVTRVEAFERESGTRFEEEVLRGFAGPAATIMRLSGNGDTQFAARSTLRDPQRMRSLLPELAPALPGILEGLQGLRTAGLSALLFVAPDAPLTPAAMSILAQVRVNPVPRAGGDAELYEVRGLDRRNREPLPDSLVYGLVGDVFVVGSTRELAEHAATMPAEAAEPAGARMRVDVARLAEQSRRALGREGSELLQKLVSSVEAEGSARDGDVVARIRVALR
jgi:hypothetical protein